MSIAAISGKEMKALREHGHSDYWEVATYGLTEREGAPLPDEKIEVSSVTVECTKCGCVLIELINRDIETDLLQREKAKRRTSR